MFDDEDANSVESLDNVSSINPPCKDEIYKRDIWNRRVGFLDYKSDLSPPIKRRKLRIEHME